jgi:tetratricopeptide (TPR) repeat protein
VPILGDIVASGRIAHDPSFHYPIQKALRLANRYDSALDCDTDGLLETLDDFLEVLPSYTIVVDALDEINADGVGKLLDYLCKVGSRKCSRVIVMSRRGCFPEETFTGTTQISMSEDVVKPEIERFIEHEIEQLCDRRPGLRGLKSKIASTISDACKGIFLLASFMLDDLREAATVNEIEARLKNFPSKLKDFYRQQLNAVGKTLDKAQRAIRDRVFLVLLTKLEPLTTNTISAILALNTESNCTDQRDLLLYTAFDIARICAPFLCVENDQLTFVHSTAREFLATRVATHDNPNEYLALKCLSKLSERQYQQWQYAARLLRKNLVPLKVAAEKSESTLEISEFYRYACLYWQEHVSALPRPLDAILTKLHDFLLRTEFVSASETLLQLKANSGMGSLIQVRSTLGKWYEALPREKKDKVPMNEFYVTAQENLNRTLEEESGDIELQYLPFVRLGQYFNVGGRTNADFQKAISYKEIVAVAYEKAFGPRNPATLRAKTAVAKELFAQKRFDEAERELREIARIQQEVLGEDDQDYFLTLLLLGAAEQSVAKFELSIATFTRAADGFRRLAGAEDLNALVTQMAKGQSFERVARYEDAYQLYKKLQEIWLRAGDLKHPFSSMLNTSIGSACRQLRRFPESEDVLLKALFERERIFGIENIFYIDSILQLAALYYERRRGHEGLEFLELLSSTKTLEMEFERKCQLTHIRALIDIRADRVKRAILALSELLNEVSGDGRDRNNRELLWARITLADSLRRCGNDDEASMVFSDLVKPQVEDGRFDQDIFNDTGHLFSLSLADEPETPAQLALAEAALRLVRDANPEEAEHLLRRNNLQWQREADFWVLQGGPVADTASMSGISGNQNSNDMVGVEVHT